MSRIRNRIWFFVLPALLMAEAVSISTARAESSKQIIVACSSKDLERVRSQVASAVIDAMPGYFLLEVPLWTDLGTIQALGKGAIQVSENRSVAIEKGPSVNLASIAGLPSLSASVSWYGTPAWLGYAGQPAVAQIELVKALGVSTGKGIRVAIIDTGVDEHHPTLQSVLLPGKNYVGPSLVPDELNDFAVSQSTAAILDQSTAAILDQSTAAILDNRPGPSEFGHGTMMAGLVHLVAPDALIIPLKAFDANGASTEWNIVRAIYDAVAMGADVINMSFSAPQQSAMLLSAVDFASSNRVVLVAAAGNDNSSSPTYPAAYRAVLGISAVDGNDQKAPFSNYGSYVALSAPGVNLISTYPGGGWAVSSGTSDGVPLVAGVVALVKAHGTAGVSVIQTVETGVDPLRLPFQYQNKLGKGRIDAYKAVSGTRE
jgi:subtilisin family serine protease